MLCRGRKGIHRLHLCRLLHHILSIFTADEMAGLVDERRKLGGADIAIFVITLCVSVAIGIYHSCSRGRQRTTREFLLADRNMKSLPVAMSMLATMTSAITILGVPSQVYKNGFQFIVIILSYPIAIAIVSTVFLPVFMGLQLTSAFEYLEIRFSVTVRRVASILFILQSLFYLAVVMYAPALALEAVTDGSFPLWATLLSSGAVCTIYTTLGGMKAVIWTDVFQSLVMVGGIVTVIGVGSERLGGLSKVFHIAENYSRLELFDFNPDPTRPTTFWSLVFGGAFLTASLAGVNQTAVQRYLTMRSHQQAKRSVWMMTPMFALNVILCSMAGLVIFATYAECDPQTRGWITHEDEILPFFVVNTLNSTPGLPGLFVACLCASTLSTISSGLNSLAAVVLEDVIRPFHPRISDSFASQVSKFLAAGFGLSNIGLAFLMSYLDAKVLWASYNIIGLASGPQLGVFTLGMLSSSATSKPALLGMVISLLTLLWFGIGSEVTAVTSPPNGPLTACPLQSFNITTIVVSIATSRSPTVSQTTSPVLSSHMWPIYQLSALWYTLLGAILVFFPALLTTAICYRQKSKSRTINSQLLSPVAQRWQPKNYQQLNADLPTD